YLSRGQSSDDGGNGLDGLIPFLSIPNTIIISQELAQEHGVTPGAEVTLAISGRQRQTMVVGLLQAEDEASRRALRDVVFSDVATAQELLGMAGRLSHIDLIAEDEQALA